MRPYKETFLGVMRKVEGRPLGFHGPIFVEQKNKGG